MSEKAAKKKAPAKKAAGKKAAKPKKEAKKEAGSEEQPKAAVERVKLGPAPQPWVLSRHDRTMRHRPAKGYSLGELASVEIGVQFAKSQGLSLDSRRRSALDENIEKLKGWYKPAPKAAANEDKPKAEKPAKPKTKKKAKKAE